MNQEILQEEIKEEIKEAVDNPFRSITPLTLDTQIAHQEMPSLMLPTTLKM